MDTIQHLTDRLFPVLPGLSEDGRWRLAKPANVGLTGTEQLLRQVAQFLEEGNGEMKPSIEEITPHPFDQASEDLLRGGRFLLLGDLNEQNPPAVEILREPLQLRPGRREGGTPWVGVRG